MAMRGEESKTSGLTRYRPNILLVMADQFAYDCIGALGHPVVRTPNLDILAGRSTRFRTAYCNHPLCAPSRASLCSGRYTHDIEVWDNAAEFKAEIPTIMHLLRHAGYRTAGAGKMHFVGPEQLHGFEERLTPDIFPDDFSWNSRWQEGIRTNSGANASKIKLSTTVSWDRYYDYDDAVLTESCRYIRRAGMSRQSAGIVSDQSRPFFLTVSFSHPHQPFQALPHFQELYDESEIPMPRISFSEPTHPFDQWTHTQLGTREFLLSDSDIRQARRAYYGMVSYIDDCVGRLIDALEESGLKQDTIVIFTSDHGEMLGEHGMWYKRTFYEESVRIPLLIACQDRDTDRSKAKTAESDILGMDVDTVVSLIDLSKTILELGGADEYQEYTDTLPGKSLFRYLSVETSDQQPPEAHAVFEYSGKGILNPMVGIRDRRYKYIHVHEQPDILFDLLADPHECMNIAEEPAQSDTIQRMRSLLPATWNGPTIQENVERSQLMREIVHTAGKHTQ